MILLSRKMLFIWTILIYTNNLIDLTNSQPVIFESGGQMAGAISYQHAKLTLNLSSIFYQFEKYESSLQVLKQNLSASLAPEIPGRNFVANPNSVNSIIKNACRLNLDSIQLNIDESEDLANLVDTL
jgi:hypothetical protein